MKMNPSTIAVVAVTTLLAIGRATSAGTGDPIAEAVEALTPLVNGGGVPIDVVWNPKMNSLTDVRYPSVTSRSTLDQIEANDLLGYAWIKGFVKTGSIGVVSDIAFPPAKNEWDCWHSRIAFGLWIRHGVGAWTHIGSGDFYGSWDGGRCYLNLGARNFIDGDTVAVYEPTGRGAFEYLVGVSKWAHNDKAQGHDGFRCEETSCYYSGTVRIVRY